MWYFFVYPIPTKLFFVESESLPGAKNLPQSVKSVIVKVRETIRLNLFECCSNISELVGRIGKFFTLGCFSRAGCVAAV